MLHLVEDHSSWQVGHESDRVGHCHLARDFVIEGDMGVWRPLADDLGKGRLAALAGAVDQDGR